MNSRVEKGFSLLEMLLVIVIVVVMTLMSTRYYESYKQTREIGLFQTSVGQLMNALNNYYFINCSKKSFSFPETDLIPTLQADQYKLIGDVKNPLGTFSAFIVDKSKLDSPQTLYVLQVTATINDIVLADYIRGALNADETNQNTRVVTWTRLPLYTKDDLSSHQWIMNQGPGQGFISGRLTTAMNTGVDSKLWIANTQVQSFTKRFTDPKNVNYKVCPH